MNKAPLPRLEFRWRVPTEDDKERIGERPINYICAYGIVLPLRKLDMRREDEKSGEIFYVFGETTCQMSAPHSDQIPFRDGAHAAWDSETLGGLPVWVRLPDGSLAPSRARIRTSHA